MKIFNPLVIKISRETLNLSIPELAVKMSEISGRPYNRQTLYNWETAKTTPGSDELPILAEALNQRTIDIFFSQTDQQSVSQN